MVVRSGTMSKPYQPRDHFFHQAKRRGLRARSAFKLDEIIDRFQLVRRGHRVLDLGAAPGGFLQVVAKAVGKEGRVVGIDTVPIQPVREAWVQTLVADVMAPEFDERLAA